MDPFFSINNAGKGALQEIQMSELSTNERLLNCFNYSGCSNIWEFLELGSPKRMELINYGKKTEKTFISALKSWFKKANYLNPQNFNKNELICLKMADVTSNIRLVKCFAASECQNIWEFLELGYAGRMKFRNYGKTTESVFCSDLMRFLSIESGNINKCPNFYSKNAAKKVFQSDFPEKKVTQKLWDEWIENLEKNGVLDDMIYYTCREAGIKWSRPFKGARSNRKITSQHGHKTFKDFSTIAFSNIIKIPAFGKKQFRCLIKAVAYHQISTKVKFEDLTDEQKFEWILKKSGLSKRERSILNFRLGIGSEVQTLAKIGEKLNVTRERIRQIQKSAFEKLRRPDVLVELSNYLDSRQNIIWGKLSINSPILYHSKINDKSLFQLDENDILAIAVYTGEQIDEERFGRVLSQFLSNRFKELPHCWYNLPFKIKDFEKLSSKVNRKLRKLKTPINKEFFAQKIKISEENLLDALISASLELNEYNGFIIQKKATPRIKRAINTHIILKKLNKELLFATSQKVHEEYLNICQTFDPCTTRDIEIVFQQFPHLFMRIGVEGWLSVGLSGTIQKKKEDPEQLSDIPEELEVNELSKSFKQIIASINKIGVANRKDIHRQILIDGYDILFSSLAYYMKYCDEVVRFAPGYFGLSSWLNDFEKIKRNQDILLNPRSCKEYIHARKAGESNKLFALWDYDMEYKWLKWARDDKELQRELLTVSTPSKWSVNRDEKSQWKKQKKQIENQLFLESVFNSQSILTTVDELELKLPSFEELISSLLLLQKEKRISWVRINLLIGRRLDAKNAIGTLGMLCIFNVLKVPVNKFDSHTMIGNPAELAEKLLSAFQLNPDINWRNGLEDLLFHKLRLPQKYIGSGWMKQRTFNCFRINEK